MSDEQIRLRTDRYLDNEPDDDVEGHFLGYRPGFDVDEADDDVEGHLQPPRDPEGRRTIDPSGDNDIRLV